MQRSQSTPDDTTPRLSILQLSSLGSFGKPIKKHLQNLKARRTMHRASTLDQETVADLKEKEKKRI
jgi:hypothetical protein